MKLIDYFLYVVFGVVPVSGEIQEFLESPDEWLMKQWERLLKFVRELGEDVGAALDLIVGGHISTEEMGEYYDW